MENKQYLVVVVALLLHLTMVGLALAPLGDMADEKKIIIRTGSNICGFLGLAVLGVFCACHCPVKMDF